jgi:hypothetical protein
MTARPMRSPTGSGVIAGAAVVDETAVVDGVDVVAVATLVRACAGVSGLDGGRFGEAVSYLPGRKVEGVMVRDGRVRVRVRAQWAVPAPALAALITTALVPLTGNRPVDVVIGDIDDPPQYGRQ